MEKDRIKSITLYPFSISPSEYIVNSAVIENHLKKEAVLDNSIEVRSRGAVNTYSIILDYFKDSKFYGRFVKLKSDNIETIDKKTFKEDLETIGEDKYIEHNAYFVWNISNNLLLAQWNIESLNVLTGNSNKVLKKAFLNSGVDSNIQIQPFPSKEFIENIIQNRGEIWKYTLSFKELSKSYSESNGLGSPLVWEMAENQELRMDIVVRLTERKTLTHAFFKRLQQIAEKIRGNTKKFVVYTDDGNFDLIGEKSIYYSETVRIMNDLVEYRNEIYRVIDFKLAQETENLLGIRRISERRRPDILKY